jgi:predicted nucleotidyltransferase component of viral defense system
MAFAENYRRQVVLLIRVLPLVAEENCFALKGGTAINLFVRDMPRLSVDIDLAYLLVQPRAETLATIDASMKRIGQRIRTTIPVARIAEIVVEGAVAKLLVRIPDAQIKIEVSPVLRGCVYEPQLRSVSEAVEDTFGFAEIPVVSFPDLYAGKFMAALDRQHPRDLFDVRDLLAYEGIDDQLRSAFIVYLLSHHRPMAEVLAPTRKDISQEFLRGFEGMTDKPVTIAELLAAREALIGEIVGKMPDGHRQLLISFEEGQPDWSLLGLPKVENLPAVRWRQQNLDKLSPERRSALVAQLRDVLTSNGRN